MKRSFASRSGARSAGADDSTLIVWPAFVKQQPGETASPIRRTRGHPSAASIHENSTTRVGGSRFAGRAAKSWCGVP